MFNAEQLFLLNEDYKDLGAASKARYKEKRPQFANFNFSSNNVKGNVKDLDFEDPLHPYTRRQTLYKKGHILHKSFYMIELSKSDYFIYISAYDMQESANKFNKRMPLDQGFRLLQQYEFNYDLFAQSVRLDFKNHQLYLTSEKIPLASLESLRQKQQQQSDSAQMPFMDLEQSNEDTNHQNLTDTDPSNGRNQPNLIVNEYSSPNHDGSSGTMLLHQSAESRQISNFTTGKINPTLNPAKPGNSQPVLMTPKTYNRNKESIEEDVNEDNESRLNQSKYNASTSVINKSETVNVDEGSTSQTQKISESIHFVKSDGNTDKKENLKKDNQI